MKFWIDKDDFIYLFQLMKAAGIENDYDEIGNIIDQGRVSVNGENVFKQRLKLLKDDVVEFRDYHIKILERNEKGEIPQEYHREAKPKGNIRHGKLKNWSSKPLDSEKQLSKQIKDLSYQCHQKLLNLNKTVSIAESCTGGMLQEILTSHSGSSKYFLGGVVCYSNLAKINILKVREKTIKKFGATSKKTATEMVFGIQKIFNSDYSCSITGIAGPIGGTKEKPVGTVFISSLKAGKIVELKEQFTGNRDAIRKKACISALKMILT